MSAATFGTDGWRGVIARDFTFARVAEVTTAIVRYLREEALATRGLVVGYDRRFQSRAFAREVAEVASRLGVEVWLAERFLPTPAVSWAVREKNAGAGIIVTASHNPPAYNGLKLKEHFGGSARPAVTARIEELLRQGATAPVVAATAPIRCFDGIPSYCDRLQRFADLSTLSRSGRRLAVDVMHGAAADILAPLLARNGFVVEELHGDENPAFDGHAPNPVAEHLGVLTALIRSGGASLGLATDGDGDRLAAIDEQGRYCGPQILFPLILWHLAHHRGERGRVVKSVSTTLLIDRICASFGLPLVETPIGFKHACQTILDGEVLLAGEESGAPGIPRHLPDRDGQLAALLLLEALGCSGRLLGEVHQALQEQFGPLHYRQSSLPLGAESCVELRRRLAGLDQSRLCNLPVRDTIRIDGVKWLLGDDAWLLIRPSGTEPLVRLYAEAPEAAMAEALLACGKSLIKP